MPLWTNIDIFDYVIPILHVFLGLVNDIIDRFFLFVNIRILQLNEEQLEAILRVEVANQILQQKTEEQDK